MVITEAQENTFKHVDTSCFLLHKTSFDILDIWLKIPQKLSAIGDRIFYASIKWKGHKISFTKQRTVAYRSQYEAHYKKEHKLDLKLKSSNEIIKSFQYLSTDEGISDSIQSMHFWPKIYM